MVKQYDFTESQYYPPGEEGGGKTKRNQDEDEGASSKTLLIAAGVVLAAVLVSVLIYVLCVTDVIPMDQKKDESPISIKRRLLGKTSDGKNVYNYRMKNPTNMEVEVLNLGSIINIVKVHDKNDKLADVVLGFHTVEGYETNAGNKNAMLGALIGQVAGPISDAQFQLNGKTHNLTANAGDHHMNGGEKGWDKFVWESRKEEDHVRLTHTSPAGSEGYPGTVTVTVTVQLTVDNQMVVNITATTNETTVINPTSNICLNLGGEGSGTITDHEVTVFADQFLKTSDGDVPIPTGDILDVNGTRYDLRSPVKLDTILKPDSNPRPPGIDQYYVLSGSSGKKLAARVKHVPSGRQVEVYTNQPGVRFYTGDTLSITGGKWSENGHRNYGPNSGFCFNSENYPDAVNQPGFPDSLLSPGSTYIHSIWYKFSAIKDDE